MSRSVSPVGQSVSGMECKRRGDLRFAGLCHERDEKNQASSFSRLNRPLGTRASRQHTKGLRAISSLISARVTHLEPRTRLLVHTSLGQHHCPTSPHG